MSENVSKPKRRLIWLMKKQLLQGHNALDKKKYLQNEFT